VFWSFAYLALRRILQLLLLVLRGERYNEIEILVLRLWGSKTQTPAVNFDFACVAGWTATQY
jgi:hypothetical protein